MCSAPTAAGGGPPPADGPDDWLEYGRYAKALWGRVVQGFERDSLARSAAASAKGRPRELPTGDPLVIGVYGEWGVGKSRLLELMYQRAAQHSAEECARRVLDPDAWAHSPALRLTVPVWFHPWKYEHEPHLAVPLLMHLTEAVNLTLKDGASLRERTREQLESMVKEGVDAAALVRKAGRWIGHAAKAAHAVAGNGLVKTTASIAAGYVGMAPAAGRALEWIEKTAERFAPGDGAEDGDADEEEKAEKPAARGPTASSDGRYYYNVQKYLRELTHITKERARAAGAPLPLSHEVHLNFVVFVDDLDRCLPEKAVEVLEVIKTVLNVESFAFVVALDDEVIERGISHRYRDYRFGNARTDMPITGFEYLEKIVHLPFRLPQLTRAQAETFLRRLENRLHEGGALRPSAVPRLWFATEQAEAGPLVPLLLDSFDAYVPRKLGRTMELMHQFQLVFADRGAPLAAAAGTYGPTGTLADARMVLCCVLLQLFAPEIFRLLRRRPELFGHWMRGYLVQEEERLPAFVWQKSDAAQTMTLEVSDADLYRWVALGSRAGGLRQTGTGLAPTSLADKDNLPPTGPGRDDWGVYLGRASLSASDRYSVEQVRLPLATALSGFRDMQRHAFAPLRLGGAMAFATGWTAGAVPRLQDYLNLFHDQATTVLAGTPAVVVPAPVAAPPPPPAPSPAAPTPPAPPTSSPPSSPPTASRARSLNVGQLLEVLDSDDAATRAAMVERLGLQPGDTVEQRSVNALAQALREGRDRDPRRLVEALAALSPFIEPASLGSAGGWPTFPPPAMAPYSNAPDLCIEIARPYATLLQRQHGPVLGLLGLRAGLSAQMLAIVEAVDTVPLPVRANAADLLGAFGDPRFDFEAARAWLPRRRALLADGEASLQEEPVHGFMRVAAGPFPSGLAWASNASVVTVELPADVFVGRTPVTVQQYAAFVAAGGYGDDALWDMEGRAWRDGQLDARLPTDTTHTALVHRPPDQRRLPAAWAAQLVAPTRPVVGVNWYEARAYAAWLDGRLRKEIVGARLASHRVRLPTHLEWERAAKARDFGGAEPRAWPWGDQASSSRGDFGLANVDLARLGRPSAVGLFPPSPIGLVDLAGNVWEWLDQYEVPDPDRPPRVEGAPAPGHFHGVPPEVAQVGGCCVAPLDEARSGHRRGHAPWLHSEVTGFRVALVPGRDGAA